MSAPLARRLFAELLGAAFLAAVVIGAGIAAQRYSPGDAGLQLLEVATATAAGLFAIILMFGHVSGGHFNPVVSLVDAHFGGLRWRDAFAYVPAQVAGCILGAIAANTMFARAVVSISTKHRASPSHLFAEVIATLGLMLVIFALARSKRAAAAPAAVGAYIGAAYWFTSSTSFAKPSNHGRADVLELVRRDRAVVGPGLQHRPADRRHRRDRSSSDPLPTRHARRGRKSGGATRRRARDHRRTPRRPGLRHVISSGQGDWSLDRPSEASCGRSAHARTRQEAGSDSSPRRRLTGYRRSRRIMSKTKPARREELVMSEVVQWIAAIVVLAAFALCQWGRWPAWSYRYLVGNLVGGAGLSAAAFLSRQWGFVVLEGVWALVAARSIMVRLSGRELHIPTA